MRLFLSLPFFLSSPRESASPLARCPWRNLAPFAPFASKPLPVLRRHPEGSHPPPRHPHRQHHTPNPPPTHYADHDPNPRKALRRHGPHRRRRHGPHPPRSRRQRLEARPQTLARPNARPLQTPQPNPSHRRSPNRRRHLLGPKTRRLRLSPQLDLVTLTMPSADKSSNSALALTRSAISVTKICPQVPAAHARSDLEHQRLPANPGTCLPPSFPRRTDRRMLDLRLCSVSLIRKIIPAKRRRHRILEFDRIKQPSLTAGTVATSAPLKQRTDAPYRRTPNLVQSRSAYPTAPAQSPSPPPSPYSHTPRAPSPPPSPPQSPPPPGYTPSPPP